MTEANRSILKFNDQDQKIQDVYIADPTTYQNIKFVVKMEHLEGWNPTAKDIEYLLDQANNPDSKLDDLIDKEFGDQVDKR